jgi:aspartyl-tRNA(Asn)/glutamyl-tRNA(Gln) amidotransferase subunit A
MNILGKPLYSLIDLVKNKEISPDEIYKYFIKRIKKYNYLNLFLQINKEYNSSVKPRLYGLPISLKDNICTKKLKTTASSNVLKNYVSPYNATLVERIIKSGGFIIGKNNMDAWAHGSSTETSDFGPSKNPWDETRTPGGSSGGSAGSVCAYLIPASIGSETAGSIRQPCAWSGVVGLKPTYGRVSRYGIIAMGSSLDSPGPIANSVKDCALLLEIIAGKDDYDATSVNISVDNYIGNLESKKKYVIGIPEEYFENVDADIVKNIEKSIEVLKSLGHKFKKIKLLNPKYAISVYTIIQRAEVSSNLSRYDGIRYGNNRTFFGPEAKKRIMLGTYVLSHGYYDEYYKKAQKVRTIIIENFKDVFNDVDLIIAPTTPTPALKIGDYEKYPFFGELMDILNEPSSIAGLPAISLPSGLSKNNLPTSVQIIGNYFKEQDILNVSNQFENETNFFGIKKKLLKKFPD